MQEPCEVMKWIAQCEPTAELKLPKSLWTVMCRHGRIPHRWPLCLANERGSVMHTTPYGYGAVYDPDALRTLGTVFENAWTSIAVNFDARSRELARLRLAKIILQLASEGATDPLELKCRAIGAMQLPRAA
jgi:hypothetical protein